MDSELKGFTAGNLASCFRKALKQYHILQVNLLIAINHTDYKRIISLLARGCDKQCGIVTESIFFGLPLLEKQYWTRSANPARGPTVGPCPLLSEAPSTLFDNQAVAVGANT